MGITFSIITIITILTVIIVSEAITPQSQPPTDCSLHSLSLSSLSPLFSHRWLIKTPPTPELRPSGPGGSRPGTVASGVLGDFWPHSINVPWEAGKSQSRPDSETGVGPGLMYPTAPPLAVSKSIFLHRQQYSPLPT